MNEEMETMSKNDGEEIEALRDELQNLKLDHGALTDTFNEVNAAYNKAHSERHKAQEDLAKLKDEVAAVEAEMERRDKVARDKYAALERDRDNVERIMREAGQRADQNEHNLKIVLEREAALKEKLCAAQDEVASVGQARDMATTLMHRRQAEYDEQRAEVTRLYNVESAAREEIDRLQGFLDREIANHEAADKLARKLSDELHVLRDKLAIMEGAESEEIARLRAMIKETSEIAMQRGRELEIVRAEAARHERRANSWQGAAQDALSQMEEMINNARAYAPGRG